MRRALLSVVLFFGAARASGSGRSDVLFFCPTATCGDQLIRRMAISRRAPSTSPRVFCFTFGELAQAMADAQKRGVKVRVVRDKSQSSDKHDENDFLTNDNIEVRVRAGPRKRGIMHDKFADLRRKRKRSPAPTNWMRTTRSTTIGRTRCSSTIKTPWKVISANSRSYGTRRRR